ncbi:acetyl esterase/lipase [Nocardia tenerifensis]|uniref:Acetyl esterase/lipase n=1 Tax=Nocardia tenerifensis TaxID=228006 RepID=A0A318KDH7_9NOCA|nr:alpha/beta hydrolase [Nocardia tenerifensis]PXX57363.1 acetyl esterase/lipase [Nocardia tenerifensis]
MTQDLDISAEARLFAEETWKSGVKQMVLTVEAAKAAVELTRQYPMSTEPPTRFTERFAVSTEVTTDVRGNEWVVHTATARDRTPERTVMFTHGGGFVLRMSESSWDFLAELITETAARLVIPLYPLAPEGTGEVVPDVVADLAARLIAEEGPERVTLFGNSVGATITLSAAQLLRDRGVPAPRLTALVVPVLDNRYLDPEMAELDELDPFLSPAGCRYFGSLYCGDLPVTDPRVSPMLGDNDHLGRVLLLSGTHDILNCQARKFAAMASGFTGTRLEYHEAPGMIHIWATSDTPEGRAARQTIYRAIRDQP